MPIRQLKDYFFRCIDRVGGFSLKARLLTLFLFTFVFAIGLSANEQKGLQQAIKITGQVFDQDNESLPGVSISLKSKKTSGVMSDVDGKFSIDVSSMNEVLIFTFVGMETTELKIERGKTNYVVIMKSTLSQLNEVVVEAGIIQRNKVGFTGSYTMVSGEELKAIGNQNVIQSLKALDPSFAVIDNSIFGSDPNTLANIEVRGQTSSTISAVKDETQNSNDANQPLFILDGFETTLARITDLDMNRVASVTILKDAGSTAIYGSKAANGVIVVETIKPKAGKIQISYKNDSGISYADLSSYNMMNASEKLEYELKAGKYTLYTNPQEPRQYEANLLAMGVYNKYLGWINQGVDTYWLKEPIRTGYTTKNSVTVSGGADHLMFNAGASYKLNEGVMKDSYRNTWEGNLDLIYRTEKLNISNSLTINGTNSQDSPYGSFSNWLNANPYFRMRNADGTVNRYLERSEAETLISTGGGIPVIEGDTFNPLYNALLNSKKDGSIFSVVNNLQLIWYLNPDLRLQGALSLERTIQETTTFIDPQDTRYEEKDYTEKGEYINLNSNSWGYTANIALNYAKTFNKVHGLTAIGRAEIGEDRLTRKGFSAQGFPVGANGIPSYANAYKKDSSPSYYAYTSRSVSALGVLNYSYDLRYLLDLTYRLDGATTFGSNKKFQPFWSVGLGWNIHKEDFAKDLNWLSFAKLRGTYGTTGNQNVGQTYSTSIYRYYSGSTVFGQGSYMLTYGNPDLEWQKTTKLGLGMDLDMFSNRFSMKLDYFSEKSDPLVVKLAQQPSSGLSVYPTSLGYQTNKGAEFSVSYYPIYNIKDGINWFVKLSGATSRAKYGGFNNALDQLNNLTEDDYTNSTNLQMYRDGYSPKDIWAVRSAGIDPATGNEVYLTKDGERTFTYNPDDRVKVGSQEADIYGIIYTSFTYKRLQVGVTLRYSLGSEWFNSALFNKVENISRKNISYNQDKRALYDRWQQPGDIAQFRRINDLTNKTYMSSRFVQKNNYLNGESISASWDFSGYSWVKAAKIEGLRFNLYYNDFFRMSTLKAERATDYPFNRTISFGLSAVI